MTSTSTSSTSTTGTHALTLEEHVRTRLAGVPEHDGLERVIAAIATRTPTRSARVVSTAARSRTSAGKQATRSPRSAANWSSRAELSEPAGLEEELRGARCVIHLATGAADDWETTERHMVRGSRALAEASAQKNASRTHKCATWLILNMVNLPIQALHRQGRVPEFP